MIITNIKEFREQNKMTKDGFYCVMEKGQDIATIRKLITINDGIMVMLLNLGGNFKPTTYLKGTNEYENFRIIGSVVQVKRYYDKKKTTAETVIKVKNP